MEPLPQPPERVLSRVAGSDRSSPLDALDVGAELSGGGVASARLSGAGAQHDFIQFPEATRIFAVVGLDRQLREPPSIQASGHLIEHLAEAVDVGFRGAGAFRREVTVRADHRLGLTGIGHEADVRQLGHAADKHDVRRLDVAVDEACGMQVFQGAGEGAGQPKAFRQRQSSAGSKLGVEGPGDVPPG